MLAMFLSIHFLSFTIPPTHWAKHSNVLDSYHHPTYNPEAEIDILGGLMEEQKMVFKCGCDT